MTVRILVGDCRQRLAELPDRSVHCVVTSPPYFGLRDYGVAGQIGMEQTPEEYVAEMVDVFREVRRVLRDDGTLWLNLGDSYASKPNGGIGATTLQGGMAPHAENRRAHALRKRGLPPGAKHKDLLMIPALVALALRSDGWYLRQDIIWSKPNPMPESVTDRCTKSHEYVFLLSKSERYFFDAEAIKESGTGRNPGNKTHKYADFVAQRVADGDHRERTKLGLKEVGAFDRRNRRSVWTIASKPYSGAHFAVMPTDLVKICIMAGTSEQGICPHCGAPWLRMVEKETRFDGNSAKAGRDVDQIAASGKHQLGGAAGNANLKSGPVVSTATIGWKPSCGCPEHDPVPATVLDPFFGAGTTGLVADRLGRHAVGTELNPKYAALAAKRIDSEAGMFARVVLDTGSVSAAPTYEFAS